MRGQRRAGGGERRQVGRADAVEHRRQQAAHRQRAQHAEPGAEQHQPAALGQHEPDDRLRARAERQPHAHLVRPPADQIAGDREHAHQRDGERGEPERAERGGGEALAPHRLVERGCRACAPTSAAGRRRRGRSAPAPPASPHRRRRRRGSTTYIVRRMSSLPACCAYGTQASGPAGSSSPLQRASPTTPTIRPARQRRQRLGMADRDRLADRILAGEEAPRQRLVDHDHRRAAGRVGLVEGSPGLDRHAERLGVAGAARRCSGRAAAPRDWRRRADRRASAPAARRRRARTGSACAMPTARTPGTAPTSSRTRSTSATSRPASA